MKKIIISIVLIVIMLIGITYAMFLIQTKTSKKIVNTDTLLIEYENTNEINTNKLNIIKEEDVKEKAYGLSFSVKNVAKRSAMSEIRLKVNNIDDALKNEYVKYKLYYDDFEMVEGNFSEVNSGDKIVIRDEIYYDTSQVKNFTLYVYIENSQLNQNQVFNKNIDIELEVYARTILTANMKSRVNTEAYYIADYRTNITQIDFVNKVNLHNAIELTNGTGSNYWDMSYEGNNTVIAWLEIDEQNSTSSSTKYHLYIGTNKNYIMAKNCYQLFMNFTNVKNINFGKVFRTDKVTNTQQMFNACKKLLTIDLKYIEISNVTAFNQMFNNCQELVSIDLSNFNTVKAKTLPHIFANCYVLKKIDISKFITKSATNISYMFLNCRSLESLDLSSFDTSNVKNMQQMFGGCSELTSLDLSNFNTSKVTIISYMFANCTKLTNLNISSFNTSNVENMGYMFYECENLITLDLSHFNTFKVTDMSAMFFRCKNLKNLNITSFDTSNVTSMQQMFYLCTSLTTLDLSSFNISALTSYASMLYNIPNVKYAYAKDEETAEFFNSIKNNNTFMFEIKTKEL